MPATTTRSTPSSGPKRWPWTARQANARGVPTSSPSGVWEDGGQLIYRFVENSPWSLCGANSLEDNNRTCWYGASNRGVERAMQDAANKSRRPVRIDFNVGMSSGVEDSMIGVFRHTGDVRYMKDRYGKGVMSYKLVRVD